jgi:hypothetical protein
MGSKLSQGDDRIYPIEATVDGKTYKEWIIEYWKAYIGKQTSLNKNPNDEPGITDDCFVLGQKDYVVFLPSLYAVHKSYYNCTHTTSNSFFFPLFSEECDYSTLSSDDQLQQCVNEHNDYAQGKLFLDSVEIKDLTNYRITTDFFSVTYEDLNPYNAPPGTYRALVDGLFIFVKPLPPGTHEIKYSVAQEPPSFNHHYSSEITYHIEVESE